MKVTVLTPSVGTDELARCVESVGGQSVTVRHVVVADGKKYHAFQIRMGRNVENFLAKCASIIKAQKK
jgi:hypothetical protein